MRTRLWQFVGSLIALAATLSLLHAIVSRDAALAASSRWVRASVLVTMLLSMFAFIVLLFCAAVGFDDRRFPPLGAGRSPTGRQLLLTYFALGATAGALALFAGVFPRLRPEPLAAAYSGLILLVGSSGRPWWLFATLRRLRLAVFIDDDRIVRSLFGIAGAVLLVLGIIGLTASTVS